MLSLIRSRMAIVAMSAIAVFATTASLRGQTIGMVADDSLRSVNVFDADTNTLLGSVSLPTSGIIGDCAITADQTLGFVTDFRMNVWVIDLTTSPPSLEPTPIVISNNGEDLSLSPDQRYLLATDGSAFQPVSVIDIAARAEVQAFSTGGDNNSITVCCDGSVIVTSFNRLQVRRLILADDGTLSNTGEIVNLGNVRPNNTACSLGAESCVVVGRGDQQIRSFLIPGMIPVDSRSISGFGISANISDDGTRLYVRTTTGIDVFAYDAPTGSIGAVPIMNIPTASTPTYFGLDQMDLTDDGTTLYVSEPGRLAVFDTASGLLIDQISGPTIRFPTGVALPSSCDTDSEPPVISCEIETALLWPPNHALIDVGFSLSVVDDVDPNPTVTVAILSDEDDDETTGAGNSGPDAVYDGETLQLRAERKGNSDGRVYLIVITATDESGNTAMKCCTVVVPKSQSAKHIASVADQAAAAEAYCEANGSAPEGYVLVGEE